ncbi:MAG: hypothetical protein IKP96_01955 [Elusimicrobiaceae bacterium]|nr:hypothetical protein [Elusimicrobiaceae bacterium]
MVKCFVIYVFILGFEIGIEAYVNSLQEHAMDLSWGMTVLGGILLLIACLIMGRRHSWKTKGIRVPGVVTQYFRGKYNYEADVSFSFNGKTNTKRVYMMVLFPKKGILFDVYVNPQKSDAYYVDSTGPIMLAWLFFAFGSLMLMPTCFFEKLVDSYEVLGFFVLLFFLLLGLCVAVFVDGNRKIDPATSVNQR